ncbi:AAA family ATPase [Myroides odoratus]|uniref:AAA family ATPase n=1 Tax=Myroides odoratus TaxID=256 RepID=UPI0039AFD223
MEKLSIRNFAGIEKLDLEIKSITILIGLQGVGKSVVVKLIYFFKNIVENSKEGRIEEYNEGKIKEEIFLEFQRIFDESIWKEEVSFVLEYFNEEVLNFYLEGKGNQNLEIEFSERFKKMLKKSMLVS